MLHAASHETDRTERVAELSVGAEAVARTLRRASVSPGVVGALACLLDAAALALGFWFAGYASAGETFSPLATAGLAAVLGLGLAALAWVLGGYRLPALRRFWPGSARLLGVRPAHRRPGRDRACRDVARRRLRAPGPRRSAPSLPGRPSTSG